MPASLMRSSRLPDGVAVAPRRTFLKQSLAGIAALHIAARSGFGQSPAESFTAASGQGGTIWGINTNIDRWTTFASSAREAIAHVGPLVEALGCRIVREGVQVDMRGNDFDPIDWANWFDLWVEWLAAHDMQLILQLNLDRVRNDRFAYDHAWEKRVTHKCREAARYINADLKRRRTIAWFLLINEPDLKTGMKGGFWTPTRLVRAHELAWSAIKSVNPAFLVQGLTFGDGAGIGASSPLRSFNLDIPVDDQASAEPGKSVPGMLSKDVFDLGVTRFCDVIGYHSYLQVAEDNPHGAGALLKNMAGAHREFGFPIRPVVNSETGCHDSQLNRVRAAQGAGIRPVDVSEDARYAAIAHWQQLNRVQLARFGVARAFYFTLGADRAAWMRLANYPAEAGQELYSKRPSFASAAAALRPRPLATLNGDFDTPEDKFSNWVVHYHPHNFRSDDLVYGEWKETHFLHGGGARGIRAPGGKGDGYVRLDAGLPKLIRRVIDGLEPGREYRVSAWVRQSGAAKATLAAYGFNHDNPAQFASVSTTEIGRWVHLAIVVTPVRSIVSVDSSMVISLEHDGKATAFWDAASIVEA
jgi:hypothetical protein